MRKVPFFARYLEGQSPERAATPDERARALRVATGIKAGVTTRYPSDEDECRVPITLKYPSDRDEVVTLKYPSDGDESPT